MREYQLRYIENLQEVFRLNAPPDEIPEDARAYAQDRARRAKEVRRLSQENTSLLRDCLFPELDNIAAADEEEIQNLEKFAAALNQGGSYLDLVLCYQLHSALITCARRQGKRDMLIRELYHGAMALFYMQDVIQSAGQNTYQWRLGSMFGEAASYIRRYDQIEDMETRGYIHRAMGNLALVYPGLNHQDGQRKMAAIRRSLRILTDPVYHEKSPGLPWDLYITRSHQERTTGLGLLRAGENDPQVLREIIESTEYVMDRQREAAAKKGTPPAFRWQYAYEAAQYHCGIRPLSYFLGWLEQAYMGRDEKDYSLEGTYYNMFLPALYADYIARDPECRIRKKEIMQMMYRRMTKYVRRMPDNQLSSAIQKQLLACVNTFAEYPDGLLEKDFILKLVACRNPDSYVSSRMAAQIGVMLADRAVSAAPELLVGALGCRDEGEVRERREELRAFVYEGCLLHNVGMMTFHHFVRHIARSWMEEEKDMYQCHVYSGKIMLEQSESTRPYVWAALGHHRFYDGSGGYPDSYSREEDPNPMLTDLISAAVHLVRLLDDRMHLTSQPLGLDQALDQVRAGAGTRLAPCWARMLCGLEPELREYLKDGQVQAYEEAFGLLRQKQ